MPLVSVVMPSYNHEKYISEAIESVLNQTFADFELIIIDDASEDKSKEIIKIYERKDNRIRTIFHNENKGIARTLNDGLEEAKGKFITFFASDDIWVKDNLKKQLEVLQNNEDLVVWSKSLVIDALGNPTGEFSTEKVGASKRKKSGDIFEELLRGNYVCGPFILKRENLKDIRYDEQLKYLNDYELVVDLAKRYQFYFVPEPLAMYRIHGGNVTLSDREVGWPRDRVAVGEYFLRKYADEISGKVKSRIYLGIAGAYSQLGQRQKAKRCVYRAIRLDPFCLPNLVGIAFASIAKGSHIRNLLSRCYQRHRGAKEEECTSKNGTQRVDEK